MKLELENAQAYAWAFSCFVGEIPAIVYFIMLERLIRKAQRAIKSLTSYGRDTQNCFHWNGAEGGN